MKESDWKIFKQIKSKALETFCSDVLSEIEAINADDSKTSHQRYLDAYHHFREKNKEIQEIFDRHSRSWAPFQLMILRRKNLADETLLSQLSAGFIEESRPPS